MLLGNLRVRGAVAASAFVLAMVATPAAALRFEHVMDIGSPGLGEGQFSYVEDFAFSADGHLLATDASHAWVQVFDRTSGRFLTRFGGKGDDDSSLEKPEGIAVDPDGNVFVADYNTGFIKKYGPSYKWLLTFSEYGTEPGQTIKSEFCDIRDGRLYVPEAGNHRVSVFDLAGKFLFAFASKGNRPGELNNPEAAKLSSDGRLYVTDLRNDRIQVFDKDGKPLASFGRTGSGPGELKSPAGLSFDRHDNVYVTEIGNDRVSVFDKTGKFLTMWGRKGSGSGEFGNLHGIIVDKTNGHVYVADTANNRIQVFRPVAEAPATTGLAR
jgi:DNA-binding beta-propeller fold protein YncE